ncbi:putative cytochrome P450 hydroxylase [alpha proteobacterium U9-1i]|nr:putative cytochrome P450 hydroxylase [alpha proteobacterium U9-1i]
MSADAQTTGGVGRYDWERATTQRTGAGAVDDPYPMFAELRAKCGVHPSSFFAMFGLPDPTAEAWPDAPRFATLTYAATEQVLRDNVTFSNAGIRRMTQHVFGPVSLMGADDPDHRKFRLLVQPAFGKRAMGMWTSWVKPRVNELIDGFVDRGKADLYFDYCARFPVFVIAMTLGVAEKDLDNFHEWAAKLQIAAAPPDVARAAREKVEAYMREVISERRAHPRDDLISLLIESEITENGEKQKITEEQILGLVCNLLPAGAGTTYRSLGITLVTLLERPELLAKLYADRSLAPAVIEEILRWNAPVLTSPFRLATADTEVAGVKIPKGAIVEPGIAAANRDPAQFDHPEEFDPFRPIKPTLAFSHGPHFCVGGQVARMELREALNALLDRLPNLRFDPDQPPPKLTGLLYRMPSGVTAAWG